MCKVLAINGAYRDNGMTGQVLSVMIGALNNEGIDYDIISLTQYPIGFCLDCHECPQRPGTLPERCAHRDTMQTFVDKIEQADAYILASPTHLGSVTVIFQRFMERLMVYTDWSWETRNQKSGCMTSRNKKAVLVSSYAAPTLLGRWAFHTHSQLKMTAKILGAMPVGTLFTGLVGEEAYPVMSKRTKAKARALMLKLR